MTRYWPLLLVALCGCVSRQYSPVPPPIPKLGPVKPVQLEAVGEPLEPHQYRTTAQFAPLAVPGKSSNATLTWDYGNMAGIVFRVYQSSNYWATDVSPVFSTNDVIIGWTTNRFETWRGWSRIAETTNRFYSLSVTGSFRFFRVTAFNGSKESL